jgi:hypothetical protein
MKQMVIIFKNASNKDKHVWIFQNADIERET